MRATEFIREDITAGPFYIDGIPFIVTPHALERASERGIHSSVIKEMMRRIPKISEYLKTFPASEKFWLYDSSLGISAGFRKLESGKLQLGTCIIGEPNRNGNVPIVDMPVDVNEEEAYTGNYSDVPRQQKTIPPIIPTKFKKQEPINLLSQNYDAEEMLHRTAKAAGIKGMELAQFLAQCAHESSMFSKLKEIGNDRYFTRYDIKVDPQKAKQLGNIYPGDGIKFKGRGYIQLTGRYNYRIAGQALGIPLEQNPDLAAKPDVAAKIAVWYWKTRVKPNVSNFTDTRGVTKLINSGLSGLEDRMNIFKDYRNMIFNI